MGYLMGIDLGTSSLKVQIMDEAGSIVGEAGQGYRILSPGYGYAEQSPEEWWEDCCLCIQKSLAMASIQKQELDGIGLSGQMHGLVALDRNGKVLRPAIIHCDTRSFRQAEEIREKLGEEVIGGQLLNPIFPGFLLPSLCWMRQEEPELYNRIRTVMLPKDFIRFRLTQEWGTDYSDASATLAFNVEKGIWCEEVIKKMELDRDIFPDCHKSAEICGSVTKEAAVMTGLAAGTPVVYGGGDQIMQNLGNGVIGSGDATITIGTSGQIFIPTERPIKNPALNTHTFCSLAADRWFLMGAILSAGVCLKWLNELTGHAGAGFSNSDRLAAAVEPGSGGVLFLPYLSGERTPLMDADIRGMFLGLKLATQEAQLTRAVMEGVTFALKNSLDTCRGLGASPKRLIASGGGANSKVWLQIQADVFDQPMHVLNVTGAAVGAAVAAGIGCGVYRDEREAGERIVCERDVVEPEKKHTEIYREYYDIFKEASQTDSSLMQKVAALNR